MNARIFPAVLLLATLGLAACGHEAPRRPFEPEPGVSGKPNPALGAVRAAIVDRPAPDRAVIQARPVLGGQAAGCALELVLPAEAFLVDGSASVPLDAGTTGREVRWTVGFPPAGGTLDAVVSLCGSIAEGPRVVEATLRLRPAP